jgi:enterochelin esterase family protein
MKDIRTKKTGIILAIAMLCTAMASGQTFDAFISRLNALPEPQRQAVADSFTNATAEFPVIEYDTLVHYIYNSAAQSVVLAGDATGWSPVKPFIHVPGTTFRYLTQDYEPDARLDYKLVINNSNWILDPKNPHTCSGGFGPNSELRMPAWTAAPETAYYGNIGHGTIRDTAFHSNLLNNTRPVKVYLPPGYPSGGETYPLILFHDGPDYLNLGQAANILDYLIAQQVIRPVIAVFVPAVDRAPEYAGNRIDLFTRFITEELMPVIDTKYKTSKDPAKRAMAGASDGGNISLYIGMKHPEMFGKIAAQSSDVIPVIRSTLANGPMLNLSFYLDIGTYDIAMLIPMVHGLRDILQSKGYPLQFREWHEGHSWGNWKGHLKLPLVQFFSLSGGMNSAPDNPDWKLGPNRPNPFLGDTRIPVYAPAGSNVEMDLLDLSGRYLETVFSGMSAGNGGLITYRHTRAAGPYILTLKHDHKILDSIIIQAL